MVSVIIPLYNVEKYIEWCLLSFENQGYKDFELIVVNDGSKDNSANIVEEYIGISKMKIKLIHQENSGVSAARNKGIENASGQYICFVDSDDMVSPKYLSDMVEILNSYDCQMVICGINSISDEANYNVYNSDENSIIKMNSHEALTQFLYRDIKPGIGSFLVKKEIIDENYLRFEEQYRYSEDIEFIFKTISRSNIVAYTSAQLYLYRVRSTSVMSLVDDKRLDGFKLMQRLESYFDKFNPEFAKEFRKFGVARWVWATLWQIVMASSNYNDFIRMSDKYNAKFYMKKLLNFPRKRISTSALVYTISPFVYYNIVKKVISNKKNREFSTS